MLKDLINKIMKRTKKVVTLPAVRASGEFLLRKTDFGLVRVDCAVIQRIAERALSQVEGLCEPAVDVEKISSTVAPIRIRLTLTLTEGHSAPAVSAAADRAINDALKELLSPDFSAPVSVKVEQVTRTVEPKRRRVR